MSFSIPEEIWNKFLSSTTKVTQANTSHDIFDPQVDVALALKPRLQYAFNK